MKWFGIANDTRLLSFRIFRLCSRQAAHSGVKNLSYKDGVEISFCYEATDSSASLHFAQSDKYSSKFSIKHFTIKNTSTGSV